MFTKTLALALAATIGGTTLAQADTSYFSIDRQHSDSSNLELGLVRSAADGVVEIYSYNNDVQGQLLGSAPISAGANLDVKVDLGTTVRTDVVAVLRSGDAVLATKEIDISRR